MAEAPAVDRRTILAKSEILRHLSAEQIEFLSARCTVRRCAAGETVFERGTPGTSASQLRRLHEQFRLVDSDNPNLRGDAIAVTLDLYSHVTATMQEDAAAKLDTVFRSAINAVIRTK